MYQGSLGSEDCKWKVDIHHQRIGATYMQSSYAPSDGLSSCCFLHSFFLTTPTFRRSSVMPSLLHRLIAFFLTCGGPPAPPSGPRQYRGIDSGLHRQGATAQTDQELQNAVGTSSQPIPQRLELPVKVAPTLQLQRVPVRRQQPQPKSGSSQCDGITTLRRARDPPLQPDSQVATEGYLSQCQPDRTDASDLALLQCKPWAIEICKQPMPFLRMDSKTKTQKHRLTVFPPPIIALKGIGNEKNKIIATCIPCRLNGEALPIKLESTSNMTAVTSDIGLSNDERQQEIRFDYRDIHFDSSSPFVEPFRLRFQVYLVPSTGCNRHTLLLLATAMSSETI